MPITAKRKNGTPIAEGDNVFAVWSDTKKFYGRIVKVHTPMRFSSLKNALLQTYVIRCKDGIQRPAHAWHIKATYERHNNGKKIRR